MEDEIYLSYDTVGDQAHITIPGEERKLIVPKCSECTICNEMNAGIDMVCYSPKQQICNIYYWCYGCGVPGEEWSCRKKKGSDEWTW